MNKKKGSDVIVKKPLNNKFGNFLETRLDKNHLI